MSEGLNSNYGYLGIRIFFFLVHLHRFQVHILNFCGKDKRDLFKWLAISGKC